MAGDKGITKWTEEEKLRFIATLLFHNSPNPSMKGLELPEGRTNKACLHVIQKFKTDYYKKSAGSTSAAASDTNDCDADSLGGSPAKAKAAAAAAAKKRKATTAGPKKNVKKAKIEEVEDTDLLDEQQAV